MIGGGIPDTQASMRRTLFLVPFLLAPLISVASAQAPKPLDEVFDGLADFVEAHMGRDTLMGLLRPAQG